METIDIKILFSELNKISHRRKEILELLNKSKSTISVKTLLINYLNETFTHKVLYGKEFGANDDFIVILKFELNNGKVIVNSIRIPTLTPHIYELNVPKNFSDLYHFDGKFVLVKPFEVENKLNQYIKRYGDNFLKYLNNVDTFKKTYLRDE
jgi:hypothetical protein